MKASICIIWFLLSNLVSFGQHIAFMIKDADKVGISMYKLDSIYQSAVNIDTSKAVFKTDSDQEEMFNAYQKLLQDWGKFLRKNNFIWEIETKGFNRVYFNKDGTIDYFAYNFPTSNLQAPVKGISEDKVKEFDRLLNIFISSYKISMSAKVKFVQCSGTKYQP